MISSKAILAFVFCILLVGCVRLTDESGKVLQIGHDSSGFYVDKEVFSEKSTKMSLFANVKGSIYETGEMMSVFGTCLDDNQVPIANTSALFNAWYPNGTMFLNGSPMVEIQPGYFVYQGPMVAVQGTYLTSIFCSVNVSGNVLNAAAWGEWQNPYWVKRIELLNDSLALMGDSLSNLNVSINTSSLALQASMDAYYANLSAQTQNITIQIGNLSVNVSNSFNTTWNMLGSMNASINATFYNLSSQIYNVGIIANHSVDRNDSYLALMLQNMTKLLAPTGSLLFDEAADSPVWMGDWSITVTAKDLWGKTVKYPDSQCYISTTQTSPAVPMSPEGNHFIYEEQVQVHGDFSWTVTCQYV